MSELFMFQIRSFVSQEKKIVTYLLIGLRLIVTGSRIIMNYLYCTVFVGDEVSDTDWWG